jgi:hypothetical protein
MSNNAEQVTRFEAGLLYTTLTIGFRTMLYTLMDIILFAPYTHNYTLDNRCTLLHPI